MNIRDVESVVMYLCLVMAVVEAFDGARLVAPGERTRQARLKLALGAGVCVIYAGASLFIAYTLDNLASRHDKLPYQQLASDWGQMELTPEEREKKSVGYATAAFLDTGVLHQHFDREGNLHLFVPTQAHIREREQVAIVQSDVRYIAKVRLFTAILWLLAPVMPIWYGFTVGRKARKNDG